jgi:gas vesicle protein
MENYDRSGGSASALAWCLFGAAAGAVAGLLLAPRTGKQTRAKLAQGWRDTLDSAGELTDELTQRARDVASRAAALAQRAVAAADTTSEALNDMADSLDRGPQRVSR